MDQSVAHYEQCLQEVVRSVQERRMTIPERRALAKKGFSFSGLRIEQQMATWQYIWNHAPGRAVRFQGFFFMERLIVKKEFVLPVWQMTRDWQNKVDDWSICDALAKIYTKSLEEYPELVYPQLEAWNQSANPWNRRQSVVSLLYFNRTKKRFLPFHQILPLVEQLLPDPEYYVQKGLGWALRELHSVYPAESLAFFHTVAEELHPIAFTIAMEKMTEQEKTELKALRKNRARSGKVRGA